MKEICFICVECGELVNVEDCEGHIMKKCPECNTILCDGNHEECMDCPALKEVDDE